MHLTETRDDDQPNLITHVALIASIQAELAARDLLGPVVVDPAWQAQENPAFTTR